MNECEQFIDKIEKDKIKRNGFDVVGEKYDDESEESDSYQEITISPKKIDKLTSP